MGLDLELRHFDDALNGILATAVVPGINGDVAIAWPEKTYVPIKGKPYLKPEMAGRNRRPMGVGANSVQEWTGTYQVSVMVPRDTGTRLQNQLASAVIRAYRRGLSVTTPQGIVLYITASTVPAPVPFEDWINLPVQISWFAHEPP
jgi:hypothetical protein